MGPKEIDRQLMMDYLQGTCSASQLRQIREYLYDKDYRESLENFLREEWEETIASPGATLPGIESQYEKFMSRNRPAGISRSRAVTRKMFRATAVAAAIILLALSIWLLQPARSGRTKGDTSVQWTVFHNEPGKRQTFLLPDSSIVYLGSASTLKYDPGYNSTNRRLILEGEAFFIVKHGGRHPFIVRTGDISTVDIGTEFNIRYYPGRSAIEVSVAKGKVEVHSAKEGGNGRIAALEQGKGLRYDSLTARSTVSDIPDTALVGAWRRGILSFRKRPLKEVTDELERFYGVSIRYVQPALGDILLTTLLDNNTLEDALEIVTVTAGVHYTRKGNTVFLEEIK